MGRATGWALWTGVAVAGAAALAAGGCGRNAAAGAAAPPERPPSPVTVAAAVARDVPVYLDEIGTTVASELVNLQSQVTGQILERRFQDGDEVKPGQVLFVIDPRTFQARVTEAQANVELARAQLELAQADFNRVSRAFQSKAVSQEDYDQKKGALDNATAQVKVNQTLLDTANLYLSYATIAAPSGGRTGSRLVDVGNIVKANETTLVTIQRLSPLYVDFTITERDLPAVRERMAQAGEPLTARVTIPERPEEVKTGTLTFLDTTVQPGAGRVRLRATLTNDAQYFWAGQFVNVRLVLATVPKAVLVPYQCIQIGQKGPYVYVVEGVTNQVGTAAQRQVTLGQRQGTLVVVQGGVKEGEAVVLTGQLAVTPGGKVAITPGAGTAPGAESAPATGAAARGGQEGAGGR
jgi:multidrug efflux system membrane fusion protein